MKLQCRLAIALVSLLAPMVIASTAYAAAGDPCAGTTCGLGGQIRAQIGEGLPLPISIAPARTGPFTLDIGMFPGLPPVGEGYGQPGQINPTLAATMMQTTVKTKHRQITLMSNAFQYGPAPQGSIGVVVFLAAVFAVQTNLIFDSPHPGTTEFGANVPGVGGPGIAMASGRPGAATVSFCQGAPGTSNTNFQGACLTPGDGATINGLARFTKTKAQFGGTGGGRTLGTVKVYFNKDGLSVGQLPCSGPLCQFQVSTIIPGTFPVGGAGFGALVPIAAFQTPTGVYSGSVGFNGTILSVGNAVTVAGVGIPFTGPGNVNVGFPSTTGMLTISVTDVLPGAPVEIFKRTGIDARDAGGNGIIAMNAGSMSARSIGKGNANRIWTTYEIPEPSAIFAASAGLFALFGCHQLVRRRSR
jgi:hypothetical protein